MKTLGQLLFSSVAAVVCEKLITAVTAVLSNHLFASVYGPQAFGELQFALALSFAVGSITLVFSSQAVAPVVGKHLRLRHLVYHWIFRLRLVSTLVVMFVFALATWLLMDRPSAGFVFAVGMVLITEPFNLGMLMAYAERMPWLVTRAKAVASGCRILWLFAAAHLSVGAPIAAIAWPIEACIAVGGPFVRYRKLALNAPASLFADATVKHALVMRCVKLWPAIAVSTLAIRLDRILLSLLLSKTDFGVYSAAAALIEQLNSIGVALALAIAPNMVFVARNEFQLRAKALRLGLCLGLLGTIAFIGSLVIGHKAFVMIYGESFEAGATVMIFATGCSIASFADAGLTMWLIGARKYRLILIKQAVTLAVMAVAPFLVPQAAIMYAPSAATALTLTLFWFWTYGKTTYRANKISTSLATASVPESNT